MLHSKDTLFVVCLSLPSRNSSIFHFHKGSFGGTLHTDAFSGLVSQTPTCVRAAIIYEGKV